MPTNKKTADSAIDLPIKSFKTEDAFAKWLESHHTKSRGIWLRIAKKDSGLSSATYRRRSMSRYATAGSMARNGRSMNDVAAAVHAAGSAQYLVEDQHRQGEALIKSGRMRPAGLAAIESAKAAVAGSLHISPRSNRGVPPELQAALDAAPKARAFFETLRGAESLCGHLPRQTAKKPETRARPHRRFHCAVRAGRDADVRPPCHPASRQRDG